MKKGKTQKTWERYEREQIAIKEKTDKRKQKETKDKEKMKVGEKKYIRRVRRPTKAECLMRERSNSSPLIKLMKKMKKRKTGAKVKIEVRKIRNREKSGIVIVCG
ncbi:hypothetical protein PUN28_003676 [Cardiocondyla obscurior]|uniref:Uncharacterized protein n=1 Tax=Cardiocondyla obscurior TaxID=286306 RepID=A0AAW2GMG9_9HYME